MSTAHSSAAISSADPGSADTKVCAALLSAWDKTGVVELARVLAKGGTLLLASGGTADALREAGLPVTSIEQYTGMAPAFGGRVKTLHPRVHAGILARRDVPEDMADLHKSGGQPIDLVCVNLYPFEQAVREGRSPEERTEMIDIGGPTLLRAAAKNWRSVAAVSDPADIPSLITELEESGGGLSARTRRQLAARVFETTARYETAIRDDFLDTDSPPECCRPDGMEQHLHAAGDLRYGENPHQSAALYSTADPVSGEDLPGGWRKLAGKSLSYNNWVDLTAAAEVAASLPGNAAVVVKHTNPCGAAVADSQTEAWERALAGDPVSAFGGIAAFNQPVTGKAAAKLTELFLEVVTAPGFSEEAVAELSRKKRLRLVEYDRADLLRDRRDFRTLPGGVCVAQDAGGED
ncbi:MAG: bifunctional phosphoribosylaminoimidazolecarboxamide formyltransferase/IMP cyclohydrolase, partial [Gemmatimonadota bacterium]|nr:bifunctional phosphoribosylaminoimidazolecarboxamide formyltransferase/IMP cyclohydrolase [Gemmatimonadota bacterium]